MPLGVGYGPYAAAPPEEEDPLAAIGLPAAGGMLPPMPQMPTGGFSGGPDAPQLAGGPAPGMPPIPMPGQTAPGAFGPGQMAPSQQDPRIAQFLAGKTPEELARLVVEIRSKGAGGQAPAAPGGQGF